VFELHVLAPLSLFLHIFVPKRESITLAKQAFQNKYLQCQAVNLKMILQNVFVYGKAKAVPLYVKEALGGTGV
jgi:hypothetical protein